LSRVLVTGAGGFIGSNAVELLLERGHEVHAVSRRAGAPRDGVVWHEADLLASGAATSVVAAAQAERLLHLAWYATPASFWSAPENERWIDATLRLLQAFGEAGGVRVTVAGSCAEYAWGGEMLSELTTPLEPATLYGACKHATHVAAEAVARELGLSLAWGRVFFLYGPGEAPGRLVSGVARALLAGEDVPTTEGSQLRDFMHVRDVAGALVALLEGEVSGAVNIASGEPVPVRDIVALIAAEAGGCGRVRFGELAIRAGEPAVIAGDAHRLLEEVGFTPAVGLEQGIAETVAWWRARSGPDRDAPAATADNLAGE
jgi:nucleoside-diphosphate-sugar epimerase